MVTSLDTTYTMHPCTIWATYLSGQNTYRCDVCAHMFLRIGSDDSRLRIKHWLPCTPPRGQVQ